ncbi:MAG: alpha/beta hydrolase-fold protein [Verrucomicrobiota bacterium]|jgi:enterochelin esterase-like enzyme
MQSIKSIALCAAMLAGLAACTSSAPDPGTEGDGDFSIGPDYTNAPELTVRPGAPKGAVHEFTMNSADSKIYPGIKPATNAAFLPRDPFGNRLALPAVGSTTHAAYTRRVWVYVPAQYRAGTAAPFLVVQDGGSYRGRLVPILDNMIAARRLPALVAIMIDSGGGDAQGSQRGLEYDTLSGRYAEFIEQEVLPRISRDYRITFTKNPDARAAMGGSSGGAAAFTMGWFHPELYHRILAYSGTFVNQQSPRNPEFPHGAWEYHDHLIAQSARKPLRIWMQVGENDNQSKDPESTFHNWVLANQRMAAALQARGYHCQFLFCKGAGHVDGRAVAQTLPGALAWLWRGCPVD